MDDLISRQAAIRACGGYMVPANIIKRLPPVTPKQRTGKWIRHNTYHGDDTSGYVAPDWRCSKCGKSAMVNAWMLYDLSDFCPNCGAKMNQLDKTCDCYSNGRCVGTKEIDSCSCGGNKSKCDFYENVRREGDAE